jgi:class 3 adenylate cyclase
MTVTNEAETHALDLLKDIQDGRRQLGRNRRFVAVLFADLCDSTSYKINRGDVDGLIKTHAHNTIVGDAVGRHRGDIIKYIGDEVMATFYHETSHEIAISNAVNAAIEMQHDIAIYNQHTGDLPENEKIQSKIGIHAGEVIMVNFPGHAAPDPQGKVVDATARIISFSNPGQILCSPIINGKLPDLTFAGPYNREAKGIKNGLELFEVVHDGQQPQEPKMLRHTDNNGIETQKLLYNAVRDELFGSVRAAISHYDQILASDPLNFSANYRKARLTYLNRERRELDLADFITQAKQAEKSHPDSGLATILRIRIEFEQERLKLGGGEPTFDLKLVTDWVERLRIAVILARSECDLYGELTGLNMLAWLLGLQFEKTHSIGVFREAKQICGMVENQIVGFEKDLQANFYDTYARVLSYDIDRQSYDKARILARKSVGLAPTQYVFETLRRLHKLGEENGWPIETLA